MNGLFDGLALLDLDGHIRRWSAPEAGRGEGEVSQWMAAAQQFAARLQADPRRLSDERLRAVGAAWAALISAAERSTGPQHNEWLLRDLWLRAWMLKKMGLRPDVPLLDPAPVFERALDAIPMSSAQAAALAARWLELDHAQKVEFLPQALELRRIRHLLNAVRSLAPLPAEHPRRGEFQAWEQVAPGLP